MNSNLQQESIANSLAPYVPPASVDEPVPLDADGMPLNYRDIAILVREVMYRRRVAALIAFFTLFIFFSIYFISLPANMILIASVCYDGSVFAAVSFIVVVTMFSATNMLSYKEIGELKRKSGYSFSWYQPSRPDPVLYAVKLLRRAGYRANHIFLPDMTQFDSVKEDSHEA